MSKKTLILLIIGLLIIAAGVGAYWYFVLRSSSDNQTPQTTVSQASKPASDSDVATVIANNTSLSSFNDALKATGTDTTLQGAGPFTVFAPSNSAFTSLPSGTLDRLQKPENMQQYTAIINYHIAAGSLLASQLTTGQKVKTASGQEVVVSIDGSNVYIIDAKGDKALVTQSDIKAKNGVIHIIDTVLLPQ